VDSFEFCLHFPSRATAVPGAYDVFVSYNWRDREAVERVARALRESGLNPFLDRWYLVAGQPWQRALENVLTACRAVAVFVGPGEMGPWQQKEKELALDRQTRSATFPVVPVLLPGSDPVLGFLGQNTWVDLRHDLTDRVSLNILVAAIQGQPPGPNLEVRIRSTLAGICPYRGLLYFREEDASFFYGRAATVDNLETALRRQNLLSLVGASGSGKTSVVRAGLIPRLRRSRDHSWEILTLFPGKEPLRGLAHVLLPFLEPEMTETDHLAEANKLAALLSIGDIRLKDIVARILHRQPGTDRLLLIVDQWEELYTLTRYGSERHRFIDEILDATGGSPLSVIATLRGDYVGQALGHRALADRLQGAQQNLGPMTRAELEQSITGPAAKVGLGFEEGLVSRILDDVGEEPGNLPLLEFVLRSLWESRDPSKLTHAAYEATGGLQQALAKKADDVFTSFSALEQRETRRIFLRLIRPGENGEDSRRRASFAELGESAAETVAKLTHERLLVTAYAPGEPDTAEVAHEALIQHWSLLRGWLNEDREQLLWHERFRIHFEEWRKHPDDPSLLLNGTPLVEAGKWLSQASEAFSEHELDFVSRSARADSERLRVEQERVERERRTARRLRMAILAVGAGFAIALVLYFQVRRQRSVAESIRDQAEKLVEFMVFNLRDKLGPIGHLDLLDEVSSRVTDYYGKVGGDSADSQRRWSAALNYRGDVLQAQGKLEEALQAYEAGRAIADRLAKQDPSNTQWQRYVAVSDEDVGDVLQAQGKLTEALQTYEASRTIRERLAKQDPSNTQWQRYVAVSDEDVGNVLQAQGKLEEALQAYEADRAIAERLAKQDPSNTQWQHDVSGSDENVGDVLQAQGKLAEALQIYEASRTIRERLAKQDPSNTEWQRDVSVSDDRVGDVLQAQGKRAEALQAYEAGRAIAERLAKQDPSNTEWQRDVSVSDDRVGDVLQAQGKRAEALQTYEASRTIRERLAKQDPSNTQWQRDVSVSDDRVGDVLQAQGKRAEALQTYEASRTIRERLAKQDPSNTQWQRDVAVSDENVGNVLQAQGKLEEALQAYEADRAIAERLAKQDPSNMQWQHDVAVSDENVGTVLQAQGKLEEALQAYEADRAIARRLVELDPSNADWRSNLRWVEGRIAALERR
jgi:tetratricopeptide (TPR) repeat protein